MAYYPTAQKIDMRYAFWRDQLFELEIRLMDKLLPYEGGKDNVMSNEDMNAIGEILKALRNIQALMLERMRDTIDDKICVMHGDKIAEEVEA